MQGVGRANSSGSVAVENVGASSQVTTSSTFQTLSQRLMPYSVDVQNCTPPAACQYE